MTRAVWKLDFPLADGIADGAVRDLPLEAKFLACHTQYSDGVVTAWFEVDPHASLRPYRFQVYGTGHAITMDRLRYLGTTLHQGGSLVLHLYGSYDMGRS